MSEQSALVAFTEFFRETEPRLKLALCAAFGPETGAEAASFALSYGWEHWDRVGNMKNPAGYLWAVGRNRARRMQTRSLRWYRSTFDPVVAENDQWFEPGLPEALSRLSERQRSAVVLVHGLGWTLAEVSSLLSISVPTVQKHVERGLMRLKKELGVES